MPAPLITELPLTNPKANAPGWAYVPQALAPDPSKQKTLLPAGTSRQRGARGGGNNSSGNGFQDAMALNAKADAAAAKRVAGDKDEDDARGAEDIGFSEDLLQPPRR
ncbi:MAG: hypothetical protein M1824_002853 [Vezdaea acicularis]|nr:MAG: hypothetical protein M1824_002853 [Vezdaea acicularis]